MLCIYGNILVFHEKKRFQNTFSVILQKKNDKKLGKLRILSLFP